ncbi:class I tRNA ligase family protein [Candidatus Vidania fulgoroideorum]
MIETLNIINISKFKVNINFRKNEIKNYSKLKLYSNKKSKVYILHDGPPYANGEIHLGHCINKILKDLILRSKYLFGYYTPFIMGWDCHGIPIEMEVKKYTKTNNIIDFKKECVKFSNYYVNKQKKIFNKLAIFNLSGYYKTTDPKIEEKEIKILHYLIKKKKVFLKKKKNNWCIKCKSTISYHEFDNRKVLGISFVINNLTVRIKNIKNFFFLKKIYSIKNSFSFINPLTNIYVYVKKKKRKKIFYKLNKNVKKIMLINDYEIIKLLKKKKFKFKIFTNYIKVCWRHKTFLISKKKRQFILKLDNKLKKKIKRLINNSLVSYPKNAKKNLIKIINDRKEWIISRQRHWGVPMCLFKKKKKFFFKNSKKIYKKVLKNIKKKGIIYWDKEKISKNKKIKKLKDTLDVWFDSGLTHTTVLNRKENPYSANMYVEGYDQYRGWFNSSIITSVLLNNKLPFKEIFVHGFALDKKGKKMSKSVNNVIKPSYIINKYGVDILRLYISVRNLKKDIKFSENDFINTKRLYLKFRNTIKFLINNTYKIKKKKIKLLELDKYFYIKSKIIFSKIIHEIEKYNFHIVIKILENFFIKDLSNTYFEILKDRIYILKKDSESRISAQIVLRYIGKKFSKIFFIFTPFLFHEIYRYFNINICKKIKKSKLSKKKIYIKWNRIFKIRKNILKKINNKDKSFLKKIDIVLNLKEKEYKILRKYKKELKFIFSVRKVNMKLKIKNTFKISLNENIIKCKRCWRYFKKINKICKTCNKIIKGYNVERKYI